MNKLNPDQKWDEWFAGVTDGDGSFVISRKENTVSLEITTHATDIRALYTIKNKLKGGRVKPRSGSNSFRFRVKEKSIILKVVERLNGKLYNPVRVEQFKEVCAFYNIQYLQPPTFVPQPNGYLSGLIDSDGSFTISVTNSTKAHSQIKGVDGKILRLTHAKGFSQISLKVTSSHKDYLEMLKESYNFGGKVYKESESPDPKKKKPNPKYHLTLRKEEEFVSLSQYIDKYPLRTFKMHRMRLALQYFKYKKLRYHLVAPGTAGQSIWKKFANSWYKYSY